MRANPALARAGGLCALIHAAVRQGTLQRDPGALADLRTLAQRAARASATKSDLQKVYQDYQQAVTSIANIQKSVHDDAMKVIANLRS